VSASVTFLVLVNALLDPLKVPVKAMFSLLADAVKAVSCIRSLTVKGTCGNGPDRPLTGHRFRLR
jgi:hypothetical protein